MIVIATRTVGNIPALTVSLRGTSRLRRQVATLGHRLLLGLWGGVVPRRADRASAAGGPACDDDNSRGGHARKHRGMDCPAGRVRAESGLLDGVSEIGTARCRSGSWAKCVTVIDIDTIRCGGVQYADPAGPGQDRYFGVAPGGVPRHLDWQEAHLRRHAPWGAQVTVTRGGSGLRHRGGRGPVCDAARSAFRPGRGGPVDIEWAESIPFIAELTPAAFPQTTIPCHRVKTPEPGNTHNVNESLHLEQWNARRPPKRCC